MRNVEFDMGFFYAIYVEFGKENSDPSSKREMFFFSMVRLLILAVFFFFFFATTHSDVHAEKN